MKKISRILSVVTVAAILFTSCGFMGVSSSDLEEMLQEADEKKSENNASNEPTENPNYESLIIDYDESYVPRENADADMVAPYINAEAVCSAYQWGAHVTALYAYLEGTIYTNQLGAYGKSSLSFCDCQDYLEGAWGVTDRESAKQLVEKMITYGHQAQCRAYIQEDESTQKLIDAIESEYGDRFNFFAIDNITKAYFEKNDIPTDDFYKVKAAACTGILYGENGLAAYDYMRMLRVIAFSEDCDYFSVPEYLEYTFNLTTALQKQYSSFEEIHQCYYLGEMFRSGNDDPETLADLKEIPATISAMKSDKFYDEADADFDMAIEKDWDSLLITRKELRAGLN